MFHNISSRSQLRKFRKKASSDMELGCYNGDIQEVYNKPKRSPSPRRQLETPLYIPRTALPQEELKAEISVEEVEETKSIEEPIIEPQ